MCRVSNDRFQVSGFRLQASSFCLLIAVFCLLTSGLTGCSPDAGNTASKPLDPIQYAFEAAGDLCGETQLREQARLKMQLVELCCEIGETDRAFQMAETIPDWRKAASYARIAETLAEQGKQKEAESLIGKANVLREMVRTREQHGTMGWTAERIGYHVVKAWLALGEPEMADRVWGTLSGEDRMRAEHRIRAYNQMKSASERVRELAESEDPEDFKVDMDLSVELLDIFRRHPETAQEIPWDNVSGYINGMTEDLPPAYRAEVYAKFLELVPAETSADVLGIYKELVAQLPGYPAIAHHKNLVTHFMKQNDMTAAELSLGRMKELVETLSPMTSSAGQAQVAAALATSGQDASGAWLEAFELLGKLHNPEPRANALVLVCREMMLAGQPFTDVLKASADRALQRVVPGTN
jgi:thioredoxin-like negative regulator of GroEL